MIKNVQMQDAEGNIIHQETSASIVKYNETTVAETLNELEMREELFIQDTEPETDGLWVDTSESMEVVGDNGIVQVIREYIDTDIKSAITKNQEKIQQISEQVATVPEQMETIIEQVNNLLEEKTNISNANLLVNGDFQIWNNGTSFKVIQTTYTANNWSIWGDNEATLNVTKEIDGIKIVNTQNIVGTIRQSISKGSNYLGETLTLSIKIKGLEVTSCTGVLSEEYVQTGNHDTPNLFFNYDIATDSILVAYAFNDAEITIEWVKLEVGNVATPFVAQKYVQELQDCLMYDGDKLTTPYSNTNYIINGDFRINQRGKTFYNAANRDTYTVDRWKLSGLKVTATPNEQGLTVSSLEMSAGIMQYVELPPSCKGQYITLSFKVGEITGALDAMFMDNEYTNRFCKIALKPEQSHSIITYTMKLDDSIHPYYRLSFLSDTSKSMTFTLEWVKLELGTIATPFVPRLYSEELAMCQRYYEQLGTNGERINLIGYCENSSTMTFPYMYKTTKRIPPTIKTTGGFRFFPSGAETTITFVETNSQQTRIQATTSGVPAGASCGLQSLDTGGTICFDAEI